jgi:hypothetical protein
MKKNLDEASAEPEPEQPQAQFPIDEPWLDFLHILAEFGLPMPITCSAPGPHTTHVDAFLCWEAQGKEDELLHALYGALLEEDLRRPWQLRGSLSGHGFSWFIEAPCPRDGWTLQAAEATLSDIERITKALPAEILLVRGELKEEADVELYRRDNAVKQKKARGRKQDPVER